MYKKSVRSWVKHWDFILLDLLSLALSLMAAFAVGRRFAVTFEYPNRLGFVMMLLMIDLAVLIAFDDLKSVVTRGYLVEAFMTLRHEAVLLAFSVMAVMARNADVYYPRSVFFLAGALYYLSSYFTRILWKAFLKKHPLSVEPKRPILIVTESEYTREILSRMNRYSFMRYQIVGLVLADRNAKGESIDGVPVVANLDDAADFLCRAWVDDVFFFGVKVDERTQKLLEQCREMALTIHYYVAIQGVDERKQTINYLAGYEVLTANVNMMEPKHAIVKRCFDIAVGLIGSVFALLLVIVLGPFIYAASPGPLIFCQERIGENGRKFKMYKLRSMYLDAEERKAALLAQSSHADGMMFKMDFDPRVIGNRILPDGTRKTGIGAFIRSTSLDEFPQFFNVLKGDMSVVGTRPPTPDEWEKYQYRHRARMSVKPGMTGLWQIHPDKDTMSFEDVVKLDTEYISKWGLGLDVRIVFATAGKFLGGLLGGGDSHDKAESEKVGSAR